MAQGLPERWQGVSGVWKGKRNSNKKQRCRRMKVTELRIGNFVNVNGWFSEIAAIGYNYVEISNGIEEHLIKELEPITLTEEWLERFGWVKSKDRSHFWHDSNLSLWFNDNGLFIESVGGKLYIKHLHQLQNLYFALTYEELQTDESDQKVNQ
jgi:hypothetical protein